MSKHYIVFSKRLAKALTKMGFEIVKTAPNKRSPQYLVYMFNDTEDLRCAISQIIG